MARLGYDALRRAGRRLGCVRHHEHRPAGPRARRGHPREPAARSAGRVDDDRPHRAGAGVARVERVLRPVGFGVLHPAGVAAADPRLRARRLARVPVRMGGREVLGLDRLRRPSRERALARRAARQRDALLAPGQRGVVGAALLGELPRDTTPSRSRCPRDAPSSRRRSSGRRAAGSRPASPTSATSTSSSAAGTSPRSSSRSSSSTRSVRSSASSRAT